MCQESWCVRLCPVDALQPHAPHQAFNRTTCHVVMLAIELTPDFISTIDLHIGLPNTLNFRHQNVITPGTCATQFWIPLLRSMAPIG